MNPYPSIAILGANNLPPQNKKLNSLLTTSVAAGVRAINVGCSDSQAIEIAANLAPKRLCIWAAFGDGGVGAVDTATYLVVKEAQAKGAEVRWWVGGQASIPLDERLWLRAQVVVRASNALMLFLPNESVLAAAALADDMGKPVFHFGPKASQPTPIPGRSGHWGKDWEVYLVKCWHWLSYKQQSF